MRKHSTAPCVTIAMFVFIFLSPLTGIADQRDLTAPELKAMLDSNRKIFLINPLRDIEFSEGHIPGSVNIPLHTILRSDKLPRKQGHAHRHLFSQPPVSVLPQGRRSGGQPHVHRHQHVLRRNESMEIGRQNRPGAVRLKAVPAHVNPAGMADFPVGSCNPSNFRIQMSRRRLQQRLLPSRVFKSDSAIQATAGQQ